MGKTPMWRRYQRLLGEDPREDVQDELRFHLDCKVEDLVAQGLAPDAAHREAERQFGDLALVMRSGVRFGEQRERRMLWRNYWADWVGDLKFLVRSLGREKAFTMVAVLVLSLGIAANTSVFSVVNTVLLKPLPFPQSDDLAWFVSAKNTRRKVAGEAGLSWVTYTVSAFEEYARRNRSFQQLGVYNPFLADSDYTLMGLDEPRSVSGVMVGNSFFQTLGVTPAYGRLFTPEECQRNGAPAVLLSYGFWKRTFGGDRGVVGRKLVFDDVSATVVGIMPEDFDFGAVFAPGQSFDIFVPLSLDGVREWGNTLAIVGRLKPGVTLEQAQAEADAVFRQIHEDHKDWWGDYSSELVPLKQHVSSQLRRPLFILWGAVALILLIVCVNLANLMLARSAARSREFATRSALGAGSGRIVRQLLTESALICAAAGAIGLVMAGGFTMYLARQDAIALPLLRHVRVDGAALGWTIAAGALAMLIAGLAPGIQTARGDLRGALNDAAHGSSAGRGKQRLRSVLVVAEVSLACVLLVGAGLLLRSFLHVLDVDLGFRPSNAVTMRVEYEDGGDMARRSQVLEEMLRQVSAIPGVESAGVTDMLPLGRNRSWGLRAVGHTYAKGEQQSAVVRVVTPGYLDSMGMRLRAGRDFSWRDRADTELVVILNESAARNLWHGEDPMGTLAITGNRKVRVVGIIANVRDHKVEADAGPEFYLSAGQSYPSGAELVIRSRLPASTLSPTVMRVLRQLNPKQPATELRPLQAIVDKAVSPRRFIVALVASFAALGLLLAALGIYGVVSYSVTQQTQEIGIRMALGASSQRVRMEVVASALRVALLGICVGGVMALVAAQAMAAQLYGTSPTDPMTFLIIIAVLGGATLIASYLPARRASRIPPLVALRAN